MLLHDFIYEWDGKSHDGKKPVSWWPGSYHVKIVRLSTDEENIRFLVPTAVILKNAKTRPPTFNTSIKNYIHTFAEKICEKYNLAIGKTLWVEVDDTIRVTRLPAGDTALAATLFAISWRPIRPNELELIEPYLDNM